MPFYLSIYETFAASVNHLHTANNNNNQENSYRRNSAANYCHQFNRPTSLPSEPTTISAAHHYARLIASAAALAAQQRAAAATAAAALFRPTALGIDWATTAMAAPMQQQQPSPLSAHHHPMTAIAAALQLHLQRQRQQQQQQQLQLLKQCQSSSLADAVVRHPTPPLAAVVISGGNDVDRREVEKNEREDRSSASLPTASNSDDKTGNGDKADGDNDGASNAYGGLEGTTNIHHLNNGRHLQQNTPSPTPLPSAAAQMSVIVKSPPSLKRSQQSQQCDNISEAMQSASNNHKRKKISLLDQLLGKAEQKQLQQQT